MPLSLSFFFFIGGVLSVAFAQVFPFPTCNVGPMHHGHIILPLGVSTVEECKTSTTQFLLSHGATFFCPHTWDIKLLASVADDAARNALCTSYYNALAAKESPIHLFRPTLAQGGLPAEALGQLTWWESPVIYHINSFGTSNADGPDGGWDMTEIYSSPVNVTLDRVLYSRQFDLQPSPAKLTYLAHAPQAAGTVPGTVVVSHYISTGGASGFDHLAYVTITRVDGKPLQLRPSWPLYVTFDTEDAYANRLMMNDGGYTGTLHVYDGVSNLPSTLQVKVTMTMDYYAGISDGFAGFGTVCPLNVGAPNSPTMCLDNCATSPSTCGAPTSSGTETDTDTSGEDDAYANGAAVGAGIVGGITVAIFLMWYLIIARPANAKASADAKMNDNPIHF